MSPCRSRPAWSRSRPRQSIPRPPAGLTSSSKVAASLQLAVPLFGLCGTGAKDLQVPLSATPRLDDFGRQDVDEELGEAAAFRIVLEVVGRLVPGEVRVEDQRQEQIEAIVDDHQLPARALHRRVVDEVLLGAVSTDVALEGELPRDDFLDRDLLVPAVAAVLLLAAGLGDVLGAAERAACFGGRTFRHPTILPRAVTLAVGPARSRWETGSYRRTPMAGSYIFSTYSLTIRRVQKRGATVRIASLIRPTQRRGTSCSSRS